MSIITSISLLLKCLGHYGFNQQAYPICRIIHKQSKEENSQIVSLIPLPLSPGLNYDVLKCITLHYVLSITLLVATFAFLHGSWCCINQMDNDTLTRFRGF
jgi:hypothetical protein